MAAFTRSLRDPFVHARNAALLALAATSDVFDETDCAAKVVPAISPSLVDKEKLVRQQATKTMELYLARIKSLTAGYPDSVLPVGTPEAGTAKAGGAVVMQPSGWTSWAVGTLAAAAGQMATRAAAPATPAPLPAAVGSEERSASAPPPRPAAPVRPAAAITPQPGGLLKDDDGDDDLAGWGALDDDDDETASGEGGETFFEALEKKMGRQVGMGGGGGGRKDNDGDAWVAPSTGASTGGVSTFGPKPFSLKNDDEVDFEALVGGKAKRKELPKGLAKKPVVVAARGGGAARGSSSTAKKGTIAGKAAKQIDSWDEGEADWGDSWT